MNRKISGYGLIAAGLLVALYGVTTLTGAGSILLVIVGGVLLMVGVGYFLPDESSPSAADETPASVTVAAELRDSATAPLEQEVYFSIIQNLDDNLLDRVSPLLEDDSRILFVGEDHGHHYSTPDRDDLPEWFALRVQTKSADRDAVMADIKSQISSQLGDDVLSGLEFNYY